MGKTKVINIEKEISKSPLIWVGAGLAVLGALEIYITLGQERFSLMSLVIYTFFAENLALLLGVALILIGFWLHDWGRKIEYERIIERLSEDK